MGGLLLPYLGKIFKGYSVPGIRLQMETQSGCEKTAAAHTLAGVCSVQSGDKSAMS